MITLGLRLMTMLTNLIVLISFVWLYHWIQDEAKLVWVRRHALILTVGLTYLSLIFFHTDSLLNIANEGHPAGYGWTFLNFQIITIYYALLATHSRAMLTALLAIVGCWFVWMTQGGELWLIGLTFCMIGVIHHYAAALNVHQALYYAVGLLFAAPIFLVNSQKLAGIDVGWPFQIVGFMALELALWLVNSHLAAKAQHEQHLKREATIDSLTQLANFGCFDRDLHAAFDRYQTNGELYALYTFDIDHFKRINDRFGHLAGNEVLRVVSTHLTHWTKALEYPAKVYRTGGEEFSILLFNIVESLEQATTISQQLRHELAALSFTFDGQPLHITISLGQDRATADDQNYLDIYRRADQYLYSSKNHGRDALTIHGQLIPNAPEQP